MIPFKEDQLEVVFMMELHCIYFKRELFALGDLQIKLGRLETFLKMFPKLKSK